jgi:hypothetical protein
MAALRHRRAALLSSRRRYLHFIAEM